MSVLFEGVVCPGDRAGTQAAVTEWRQARRGQRQPELAIHEMADRACVAVVTNARGDGVFVEQTADMSAWHSSRFGRALNVFHDSRTGTMLADAYVEGELTRSFDEKDETFVLQSESGPPLNDAPRFACTNSTQARSTTR